MTMEPPTRNIATSKIIWNDYFTFLLTIAPPIAIAIAAFTATFGFLPNIRGGQRVDRPFIVGLCVVTGVAAVILLGLLLLRIARIKRVLATGTRTTAHVVYADFWRDRGRIEFEYQHQGQKHRTGVAVMKNDETTAIDEGDELEVAIDPDNPRRAYVVTLYSR